MIDLRVRPLGRVFDPGRPESPNWALWLGVFNIVFGTKTPVIWVLLLGARSYYGFPASLLGARTLLGHHLTSQIITVDVFRWKALSGYVFYPQTSSQLNGYYQSQRTMNKGLSQINLLPTVLEHTLHVTWFPRDFSPPEVPTFQDPPPQSGGS